MKRLLFPVIAFALAGFVVSYFALTQLVPSVEMDPQDKFKVTILAALAAAALMAVVYALRMWEDAGKVSSWVWLKHEKNHYVLGRTDHGGETYLSIFHRSKFGRNGVLCFAFDTVLPKEINAGTTFIIYPDRKFHSLVDGGEADENVIVLYVDDLKRVAGSKNVRQRKTVLCPSETT